MNGKRGVRRDVQGVLRTWGRLGLRCVHKFKKGSYRRWRARTCAPPWWRAACGAPCRRWTCARSAWYEPFCERLCGCVWGKRRVGLEPGTFPSFNCRSFNFELLSLLRYQTGRLCSGYAGVTDATLCGQRRPITYNPRNGELMRGQQKLSLSCFPRRELEKT